MAETTHSLLLLKMCADQIARQKTNNENVLQTADNKEHSLSLSLTKTDLMTNL